MTSFSIFIFVDSPHTHGRWVRSQYMWVEEGLKTIHCCGWTIIILEVGLEFNQVLSKCSKLHSQVCQPNPFVSLVALECFKGWDFLADSGNLVYMSIRVSKDATSLNPITLFRIVKPCNFHLCDLGSHEYYTEVAYVFAAGVLCYRQ
jgi:hypothetical protein